MEFRLWQVWLFRCLEDYFSINAVVNIFEVTEHYTRAEDLNGGKYENHLYTSQFIFS